MSVAKRPFSDPRNTYIVDNNDSRAFDKRYKGTPGTHKEQRCCGDRAPYWEGEVELTGYIVGPQGERRSIQSIGGYNAEIPAGFTVETKFRPTELYCHECQTYLEEQWSENFVPWGDTLADFVRGIAMVVSYVPVFGTAVSFILNASVSLAEGKSIDDATLDAIGGALPGQPISGAAFNAVRSIANGDRWDKVAISALPLPPAQKDAISTAVDIVEAVAEGKKITNIALDQIYQRLPPQGKKAMNIARRLADGEDVGDVALAEIGEAATEAMRYAAKQARIAGDEAVGSFIAQSGYQGVLDTLPKEVKDAVTAGLAGGVAQKRMRQVHNDGVRGMTLNSTEFQEFVAENNALALKGQRIINSGAVVRKALIAGAQQEKFSDIRNKYPSYTMTVPWYDPLNNVTAEREYTAPITDEWRRGFDVAVGLCEGMTEDGPGQRKVHHSLNNASAKVGFLMGQALQHRRSIQTQHDFNLQVLAFTTASIINGEDRKELMQLAWKGHAIGQSDPRVATARRLVDSGDYRWGFDIATAACQGKSAPGPGQDALRSKVGPMFYNGGPRPEVRGSNQAMQGFNVGQALQHGISKALLNGTTLTMKSTAAKTGELIAGGLSGSKVSPRTKADTIHIATNDGLVAAGAAKVIKDNASIFSRLKVWLFGQT